MKLAKLDKYSVAHKFQEHREHLTSKGALKGFLASRKLNRGKFVRLQET